MHSWKSRVEMSSQQKEDQHACRVTRKKVHVRKMLGTLRIDLFFQWFVLPDVRKVASLKRRVRRYVADRWKMARRCGAKHICKSKCSKHLIVGAIFEVAIRKNGTPLWREAHLQVKMHKTPQSRSNLWSSDVQKWHAAVARSTFVSENVKKLTGTDDFLNCRCTPLWREAHLQVTMYKTPAFLQHFERFLTD